MLSSLLVISRLTRAALLSLLLVNLVACGGGGSASVRVPAAALETSNSVAFSSELVGSSSLHSSSSSSARSAVSSSLFTASSSITSTGTVKSSAKSASLKTSSKVSSSVSSSGYLVASSVAATSISLPVVSQITSSSASSLEATPDPVCPEGHYLSYGECIYPSYPVPTAYSPAADEVVIYFNAADRAFAGYSLYLWQGQGCANGWAEVQNDSVNTSTNPFDWYGGLQISTGNIELNQYFPPGYDPIYGAYFVVKINPAGSCGNFILRSPGLGSWTVELKVNTSSTGSPFDRMFFIIKQGAGLQDAIVSETPICINNLCVPYSDPLVGESAISIASFSPPSGS